MWEVGRLALAWYVGATLLLTGCAKICVPSAFRATLEAHQILPTRLRGVVALIVPTAEILIGLALLCGVAPRLGFALAAALLTAFAGYRFVGHRRQISAACGCTAVPAFSDRLDDVSGVVGTLALVALCLLGLLPGTAAPSLIHIAAGAALSVAVLAQAVRRRRAWIANATAVVERRRASLGS